ncbi:MAG: ABC transporter permease [Actinobacteria bacterium]|nr:ABC transporter permease [Actinomycetota bacterium]
MSGGAAPPVLVETPDLDAGTGGPQRIQRRWGRRVLTGFCVLVFLWLFAPLINIVAFTFNRPLGRRNLTWNEFTLENWAQPFKDVTLTSAFLRSLLVSAVAVSIALVLGSLMAIALARYRFSGSKVTEVFLVLPLTTPEIVMGASLYQLFLNRNVTLGFSTIVIAHIMFCVSFVALTVKARVRGFDWTLEDAAMDLGSSPWRTFRKVTFPLILPGILAAALLSFALSLDDYIITDFTKGEYVTFPIQVNNQFKISFPPQVNVLATMILVVSVLLLVLTSLREDRSSVVGR